MNWARVIHKCGLVCGLLLNWFSINASDKNYFTRLEQLSVSANPRDLADSIIAIPYDVMVDHFETAASWLNKAVEISFTDHLDVQRARAWAKLATILYLQGKYDLSLDLNLKSIQLFDSLHMDVEKGAALCELGYQMKRRNLNDAFFYFRQGLLILEKNNAVQELTSGYDNFGVLYEFKSKNDSADFYYRKALQLKETLSDSIGIPYSLNNLGMLKIQEKNFEDAKIYFDRAFEIRKRRNDLFGLTENEAYYGDLYREWNKYEEAIYWYLKSNESAALIKYPRQIQYNFEMLVSCYEKSDKPREALDAARKSAMLKDELLNEKNSKVIIELEQRFRVAEKDKDIAVLQSKATKRTFLIYIITSALILLVLGGLLYNINFRRKAAAQKDAAIISEREQGLKAVFDATENERKRIAKDLHDGIGQQLSGLRMSLEALQSGIGAGLPDQKNKLKQLNTVLDEACADVRQISHQMMPKVLQERGLLPAFEELLRKSLGLIPITYRLEHFKVQDERFNERIEISLYRIAQELINNIIKHSHASEVIAQFYRNKNYLVFIVEDNGVGFISDSDPEGIGMMNITSRLSTIQGEVTWAKGPVRGVVTTIRIPVDNQEYSANKT